MASGTIKGSTSNQYIDVKIEWSSIARTDVAGNSSSVTAALYYKRNNTGYETSGTGTFSITVGNSTASARASITITENGWVKAIERTFVVEHNDDGTKSVTISASGIIQGTTLSSTSCSGTVTLDTIPRASLISSASDQTLGTACSVKWTPYSTSFGYKLKFSLGGWSYTTGVIAPKTKSAYTYTGYTIPLEVANQLPNAITGTMRVYIYTYSDTSATKQIGLDYSKTFTVTVPNNTSTKPSVAMSLSPVSSLASPFSSLYIQGKSRVQASLSGSGKYSSTISSYYIATTISNKTYNSPYQSDFLATAGTFIISGTATDSRGYSNTVAQNITVIPYSKPKILPASGEKEIVCERCDENGNISDSGTYLKIRAKRSYSAVVSSGVQQNFCTIRYRFKTEGATSYSSWETILSPSAGGDEVETEALLGGALLPTSTYMVQIGVVDSLGETDEITVLIPTDKVYMHKAGSINSLGIGKYAEDPNTIDVAEDITTKFRGKVIFAGEEWESLGLSANVAESGSNIGRVSTGCYYRVNGGRHVYVAFNCAFTHSGDMMQVNTTRLPTEYRPVTDMYSMCAVECDTGGRAIARVIVTPSGKVLIDWVQLLSASTLTTSSTVKWIDGYIDYWV